MTQNTQEIRIGLYNSTGNLLGYKIDSFWTLDTKEEAKKHYLEEGKIRPNLISNLLYLLNEVEKVSAEEPQEFVSIAKNGLRIIAESPNLDNKIKLAEEEIYFDGSKFNLKKD